MSEDTAEQARRELIQCPGCLQSYGPEARAMFYKTDPPNPEDRFCCPGCEQEGRFENRTPQRQKQLRRALARGQREAEIRGLAGSSPAERLAMVEEEIAHPRIAEIPFWNWDHRVVITTLKDALDESRAREAALREAGLALFDHAEEILGNSSEVYVLIQDMDALRALLAGAADARPGSSGRAGGDE